jgi:hypothetical protein
MSPVCTIAAKYCEKFIDGNSSSVKTCWELCIFWYSGPIWLPIMRLSLAQYAIGKNLENDVIQKSSAIVGRSGFFTRHLSHGTGRSGSTGRSSEIFQGMRYWKSRRHPGAWKLPHSC